MRSDDGAADPAGEIRLAALVLSVQSLGLVAAGLALILGTVTGGADNFGRAAAEAVFALGGAVLLLAAARGLLRFRPAARTPVVVLEVLALPVGYSLGFQAGRIWYGGPLILSAVTVIYLLFTPAARRVLDR